MDLLGYVFMQRALLEAVLVGGICALAGVFVVLNGLSFIGAGISHSAFGGIALGFLLGTDPVLTALVFVLLVTLGIGEVKERSILQHDTIVGIFFAATMAFGVLAIGLLKGTYIDVFGYLFGNILALTAADLWQSAILAAAILALVLLLYKELVAITFDREFSRVIGIPVRALSTLLLVMIAVSIVLSVKSVGIVLVSALIVTPAATARLLTRSFPAMLLCSTIVGIGSSVLGLFLSVWFDISSGAAMVLTSTAVFFVSWLGHHLWTTKAGLPPTS